MSALLACQATARRRGREGGRDVEERKGRECVREGGVRGETRSRPRKF